MLVERQDLQLDRQVHLAEVDVRKVDLAVELQILSFHEHRKASLTALPGGRSTTGSQEAVGS